MTDFLRFCIGQDQSIRAAMRQLDEATKKILFVTDNGKLVASLTDGDLRRFLLGGGSIDDAVYSAAFKQPHFASSRDEAVVLLKREDLVAVPVIAEDRVIVDIVFAVKESDAPCPQLGLPVVIMAGGKGTRLDPYTRVLPKPLIPVGELPIIEHIMQQFSKYGCDEFHIIVNHKKQLIKAYFAENERHYNIRWYDEEKPMGTGGGLAMLKQIVTSPFFLTNCDILIQADYADILRFHRQSESTVTMVCAYKNVIIPYGVIETGFNGEITAMKEKPELSFQTNTGMYLVDPEVLDDMEDDVPIGFPDVIERQQKKGRRVSAYPVSENAWSDMGQLTELEKMRKKLYGE